MATSPPEQPPIIVFTIVIPTAAESPGLVMLSCKIGSGNQLLLHCDRILFTNSHILSIFPRSSVF